MALLEHGPGPLVHSAAIKLQGLAVDLPVGGRNSPDGGRNQHERKQGKRRISDSHILQTITINLQIYSILHYICIINAKTLPRNEQRNFPCNILFRSRHTERREPRGIRAEHGSPAHPLPAQEARGGVPGFPAADGQERLRQPGLRARCHRLEGHTEHLRTHRAGPRRGGHEHQGPQDAAPAFRRRTAAHSHRARDSQRARGDTRRRADRQP